jgi:hypothetical protein
LPSQFTHLNCVFQRRQLFARAWHANREDYVLENAIGVHLRCVTAHASPLSLRNNCGRSSASAAKIAADD